MSQEELDIEKLVKVHLSDASEQVPENLFEQIEATILKNEKKKKRFLFWWWILGGLGILLLGIVIGNYIATCNCQTKYIELKAKNHLQKKQYFHESKKINTAYSFQEIQQKNNFYSTQESNQSNQSNQLTANLTVFSNQNKSDIKLNIPTDSSQQTYTNTTLHQPLNKSLNALDFSEKKEQAIDFSSPSNTPLNSTSNVDIETLRFLTQIPCYIPTIPNLPDNQFALEKTKKITTSKTGFIVYAGPVLYKNSLFKPYFKSGQLAANPINSEGIEYGLGLYRNLSQKVSFNVFLTHSIKKSGFTYNIMVGENDYFDLYLNDEAIPLENLDNPNSCNCFLIKDVKLNYKISTYSLKIGGEFNWTNWNKFRLKSQFNVGSNIRTTFTKSNSNGVIFPEKTTEIFNSIRFSLGTGISYQLLRQLEVGIIPFYTINKAKVTSIFSKATHEIIIPFQLKFSF